MRNAGSLVVQGVDVLQQYQALVGQITNPPAQATAAALAALQASLNNFTLPQGDVWDPTSYSANMQLSNAYTIWNTGAGWSTVIGVNSFTTGVHFCEFTPQIASVNG